MQALAGRQHREIIERDQVGGRGTVLADRDDVGQEGRDAGHVLGVRVDGYEGELGGQGALDQRRQPGIDVGEPAVGEGGREAAGECAGAPGRPDGHREVTLIQGLSSGCVDPDAHLGVRCPRHTWRARVQGVEVSVGEVDLVFAVRGRVPGLGHEQLVARQHGGGGLGPQGTGEVGGEPRARGEVDGVADGDQAPGAVPLPEL
ncbi:hypothetical protein RB200_23510 [Streptomyces sp. PmtG]